MRPRNSASSTLSSPEEAWWPQVGFVSISRCKEIGWSIYRMFWIVGAIDKLVVGFVVGRISREFIRQMLSLHRNHP